MTPRIPYVLISLAVLALATRAQETITLRVASWAAEKEFELERHIIERFMARHPGVRVEFEAIPSGYPDKILASFASGTVPDVFLLDSSYIPRFLNRNLLLDLRPAIDSLGLDLDAYFLGVRRVFEKDGALYALPKDVMVGNESSANVQGINGMFYGGRLATMPSGRWAIIQMMPYIRVGEINIGVVPLPTPPGGEHVTVLYAAG